MSCQLWTPHLSPRIEVVPIPLRQAGDRPEDLHGSFYKLGVLFAAVLIMRALLFWVHIRAPDYWKLPHVRAQTRENCNDDRSAAPRKVAAHCDSMGRCLESLGCCSRI